MAVVTTGYDAATTQQMAALVALAHQQFAQGLADPGYDGRITPPAGWTQTAAPR